MDERAEDAQTIPQIRGGILPTVAGLPPRVWFSCNAKLNTGNYESMGVDIGCSDDVKSDETLQEAMGRISDFCIGEMGDRIQEIRAAKALPPAPPPKSQFSKR